MVSFVFTLFTLDMVYVVSIQSCATQGFGTAEADTQVVSFGALDTVSDFLMKLPKSTIEIHDSPKSSPVKEKRGDASVEDSQTDHLMQQGSSVDAEIRELLFPVTSICVCSHLTKLQFAPDLKRHSSKHERCVKHVMQRENCLTASECRVNLV
jgi:hypothetical protein